MSTQSDSGPGLMPSVEREAEQTVQAAERPTFPLHDSLDFDPGIRRDIRVIRGCAIAIVVVVGFAAAIAAADVLAPTAIAIVLALVLAPIARAMERIGLPSGISSVLAVLITASILTAGAMTMAPAAMSWLNRAPEIISSVERKMRPLKQQIAAVENVSKRITEMTPGARAEGGVASESILMSAVRSAPGFLAKTVYIAVLTIFLLAFRKLYTTQIILLPRRFENRIRMARICRDVRHKVSQYLFTLAMINAGLAVVTAGCFYLAGLSDPILWGVFFGIMNFIPIIGPTTVILSGAIVGFATGTTIAEILAPPLILLALDTVEANLVQPWLLSRRIVISPVAIFITVVLLVWMWGPTAAITAVPALIIFHTVSLRVPALRAVAMLLATERDRTSRDERLRKAIDALRHKNESVELG